MKIVYIADLHLRSSSPINRKDDYVEAQFRKLDYLINYANDHGDILVIGGDVFDRATGHSWGFINRVLEAFSRRYKALQVYVIPGNHDLLGHNIETMPQNSLSALSYVKGVSVITESSVKYIEQPGAIMPNHLYKESLVAIHLTPFGMTPIPALMPEFCPKGPGYNVEKMDLRGLRSRILVVHEPVFETSAPFYMPDALSVEQLEEKYPGFDLYLAGDIHIPCQKSKTLVSGSMMRMTTAQKDHKPRFYVTDSDTLEVDTVFFPLEEDVWKDVSETVTDEEFKDGLQELVEAMQSRDEKLDYAAVCRQISGDHWPILDGMINDYIAKKEK